MYSYKVARYVVLPSNIYLHACTYVAKLQVAACYSYYFSLILATEPCMHSWGHNYGNNMKDFKN